MDGPPFGRILSNQPTWILDFSSLGGCLEVKPSLDTSASNDNPHCVYLKGIDVLKIF